MRCDSIDGEPCSLSLFREKTIGQSRYRVLFREKTVVKKDEQFLAAVLKLRRQKAQDQARIEQLHSGRRRRMTILWKRLMCYLSRMAELTELTARVEAAEPELQE